MENHTSQFFFSDTVEFIDRVCSLRGMNKEVSKVNVGINCGKPFLNVSPTIKVDCCNGFNLHQSSLSASSTGEALQSQIAIVYFAKINEIVEYI